MRICDVDIETTGLGWHDRVLTVGLAIRDDSGRRPEWANEGEPKFEQGLYTRSWRDSESAPWVDTAVMNMGYRELFTETCPVPWTHTIMADAIEGADWLCFHNGSFDLPYLFRMGLLNMDKVAYRVWDTLGNARSTGAHDYVGFAHLLGEHDLYDQGDRTYMEQMKGKRRNLAKADPMETMKYNAHDVRYGIRLFDYQYPIGMDTYGETFMREEGEWVSLVSHMRHNGKKIDVPRIEQKIKETRSLHRQLMARLAQFGIRSPDSNQQISKYVDSTNYGGLPLTEKGNPKADYDALCSAAPGLHHLYEEWFATRQDLPEPESRSDIMRVLGHVLAARRLAKELDTWLEPYLKEADDNDRIHPNYMANGTVSYRLTCDAPADQAVPGPMKNYRAEDGKILYSADYSQAELRKGGAYGRENSIAQAYADDKDIHRATADTMIEVGADLGPDPKRQRSIGKTANFTGFYGGGANALAENLGVPIEVARTIVSFWRDAYPGVWRASKQAERVWVERGYIKLHTGKRLYATDDDKNRRPYKAFNQLIQAGVAECIRLSMMQIYRLHKDEVTFVGQIHDSIEFEAAPDFDTQHIRSIMTEAGPASILNQTTPPIVMEVDVDEMDNRSHHEKTQ